MSFAETPILSPNNNLEEEKIRLFSCVSMVVKFFTFVFFTILTLILCLIIYYITYKQFNPIFIIPGIFFLIETFIIVIFCYIPDGTVLTINNTNKSLKLQKTCNHCCKKPPKIIDLDQIEKINNYTIIYKNGIKEDISNYFQNFSEKSLEDCQNLLRKYLVVENTRPQITLYYPNMTPIYNNTVPNQQNAYYAITPQGLSQNYYQQNYNANNIMASNNQNIPTQQNLIVNDDISKPTNYENCETPNVAK